MAETESKPIEIDDDDLEDGEIEDDEEEVAAVEQAKNPEKIHKEASPMPKSPEKKERDRDSEREKRHEHKEKSKKSKDSDRDSKRSKDRRNFMEDDFASSIESQLATVLKKEGVEPPLPSIKKSTDETGVIDDNGDRDDRHRRSSRKRKRRSQKNNEKKSKNENEGLYMVGGSPQHSYSEEEGSDESYDSYDSEEYHRSSYEDRRNKRREKYGQNDRDRKKRRKSRDDDKEICLRFSEFGSCPDGDNCTRLHEVRAPKKMELCKFYLMECCAKRNNCSYMHGDFPCKYYYLGMKCQNKDCKFLHGKPLTDNLKEILLKHLDTAPKEILGDFTRMPRSTAITMINARHAKLLEEFGMAPKKDEKKIPSLLDMVIKPPESFKNSDKDKQLKKSRWLPSNSSPNSDFHQNKMELPTSMKVLLSHPPPPLPSTTTPSNFLSLRNLTGVLSAKQIEDLEAIGIESVHQINHLTVAQLNELGLTVAQISEIQLNALNIQKLLTQSKNASETTRTSSDATKEKNENPVESQESIQDVDLRVMPPIAQLEQTEKTTPMQDVDMRFLPPPQQQQQNVDSIMATIASPDRTGNSIADESTETSLTTSTKQTPVAPAVAIVDFSQYLKDSNLNEDNEDENELKIDESFLTSDHEEDKKDPESESDEIKHEQGPIQLLPPSINPASIFGSAALGNLPKVDVSSSVFQFMNEANEKNVEKAKEKEKAKDDSEDEAKKVKEKDDIIDISKIARTSSRDPRTSLVFGSYKIKSSPSRQSEIKDTIASPTYDPRSRSDSFSKRPSIYESNTIESPSEDEDVIVNVDKDKDMRLQPFMRDSENGDIDLRFPFSSSLSNYVPATEINGSYDSHPLMKYNLKVVDVPKPDYNEIKRNFRQSDNVTDPRLKKIFGIAEETKVSSTPLSPDSKRITSPTIRGDPRKRKTEDLATPQLASPTKSLEIRTILQNSQWYYNLNSNQKIMTNTLLAELAVELKRFRSDTTPNKLFDITYITQRPMLNQVLNNLRVFVNSAGEFEDINDAPNLLQPQNMNQMQMTQTNLLNMNNMSMPPPMLGNNPWDGNQRFMPPNMPPNMRPGLLGMAPNMNYGSFNDPGNSNYESNSNFNQYNNNNSNNNNRSNNRNNNYRNNQDRNWRNNSNNNQRRNKRD